MRYRLRTLLIPLALLPPVLAAAWARWAQYRAQQQCRELARRIDQEIVRRLNPAPSLPAA